MNSNQNVKILCIDPTPNRNKFVLTVTVIAVNCLLAVVFSVKRGGRGISRHLLFIFMANMGIYIVYYIVMKCYLR